MPLRLSMMLLMIGLPLVLTGCNHQVNNIRAKRFANPPLQAIEVQPSALSLELRTTANGQSFTAESIDSLNQLLLSQGRLPNQTLTLIPQSPAGERIAARLGQALRARGLPAERLRLEALRLQTSGNTDLTVVSEALVVQVPTCGISQPHLWSVQPYAALGGLGCANQANIAAMVSNPRDLISPQALAAADGNHASSAVQRYHENDLPELIDINFENDD